MYNLNDPDLSNFVTITQHDNIKNIAMNYNFLRDMNYDSNYGDKKSNRYIFIKRLVQSQLGSGFIQYVSLPSDPDELVDQLKLIVLEKVRGKDNPMLSEQIIAITDKLLEYESFIFQELICNCYDLFTKHRIILTSYFF